MAWKFERKLVISFSFFLSVWLLFSIHRAFGTPEPSITLLNQRINLAGHLRVLADSEQSFRIEHADWDKFQSLPLNDQLTPTKRGYYWILTPRLQVADDNPLRLYMKVHSNSDYDLRAFLLADGKVIKTLEALPLRHPSFEIRFDSQHSYQVLFQVKARTHFWFDPVLMNQHELWIEDRNETSFLVYCIGTILSALVFNLAMFVALRDLERLWFVGFTAFCLFAMLLSHNLPEGIQRIAGITFQEHQLLMRSIGCVLSIMFLRSFFHTPHTMPKVDKFAKIFTLSLVFLCLQNFSHPDIVSFFEKYFLHLSQLMTMLFNLFLIGYAIYLRLSPARLLFVSWLILTLGSATRSFSSSGTTNINLILLTMPLISLTIETILTTIALNFKFRELKRARQDASERQKEAQKLKFFLRIICHDLANPLSVVSLSSNILNKKYPDDKLLRKLSKSTKIMTEIVEYVRDSESTESQVHKHEAVSLQKIIEEVLLIFDDLIRSKNLTINIHMYPDMHVYAHETNLKMQVFANLISNAIKFSPEQGTVTISGKNQGMLSRVEITDQGEGIPEEVLNQLTAQKPRLQSKLGTKGEVGSGFGLILAAEALEQCGGKMQIESNPYPEQENTEDDFKVGTRITLYLRIAPIHQQLAQAQP
ncbi:MAG: ATP-binding protein [Oligoflexus sp.]